MSNRHIRDYLDSKARRSGEKLSPSELRKQTSEAAKRLDRINSARGEGREIDPRNLTRSDRSARKELGKIRPTNRSYLGF